MKLTVVGCGDAFGSGGRLQTSYLLDTSDGSILIDCGATALIGLNRIGRDANRIGTVVISHLHGDHFAGLVWMLLQAKHITKRKEPLAVFGPSGIEARFVAAAEALFPGSSKAAHKFDLTFTEMQAGTPIATGPMTATAHLVEHPSGAPSHALRFEGGGKVVSFTGDTQWVDALVPCGANADLYIMECFRFDEVPRYHLSWRQIEAKLDQIGARKVLLTHMSAEMLDRRSAVTDPRAICAEDGMVIEI
jgi:ribonuclease BN (tRNA processing enzyme)